ncbi:hypothetical protein MACK_002736 [Theileria orientalis]|uniref:Uncharacterized protein n=1 Tax=Theileria orientalis TaxID=68886 RepID=A0A976MDU2_THEOR|nr:hypothetical protein MACK_002736 [Theileria orientalis]
MGQNPTLQVGRISKCQKMEMAMESIRKTQKLGDKPWVKYNKVPNRVFDKEKVNVFMKLCLATKKSVTPRNHTTKQAPLENVNYNKQLEELDILVDIIKKTGNVVRSENYRPLVHVPLPREFYELKPLVSFKSIATKSKKRSQGTLHEVARDLDSRSIFRDVPTEQVYGETKRLHSDIASSTNSYSQDYVKLVTRKQEETRVDKSTSISSRARESFDKSTSISSRARENFDKSTSISSRVAKNLDKATITTSVSLNLPEKNEHGDDGDMVGIKYDLRSEDTVVVLAPQRVLQKVDKLELPSERGILREMSTISSNPFDNQLSTYPSFDSVQFAQVQPDVVDATELYLMDNSWAPIDPVTDPLENLREVTAKRSSRKSKVIETVEPPTQENQVEVLAEETKPESKLGGYTEQMVTLLDKYNEELETKRYNTLEDESVDTKPHEPLEIKPENKESASKVQFKEELEPKTAVDDADKDERKSHDDLECEKYKYDEHKVDESKESNVKRVTYFDEVPELNLKSVNLYDDKKPEAIGIDNVDQNRINLELQDEFNKIESELFEVMESDDRQLEEKRTESIQESVEGRFEEVVDRQPVLQQQFEDQQLEAAKHTEQTSAKSDEQSGAQEYEQKEGVQSDEQPEVPLAIADKPRRRRARSHKRSKKSLPGVELSDYKGFYVVHATNDWSLS